MKSRSISLDEWYRAKTEFSRSRFFAAVREMLSGFVLDVEERGDELYFTGKTVEQEFYHFDEKEYTCIHLRRELNIEIVAVFKFDMCSIDATYKGFGQWGGVSYGLKTVEDLKHMYVPCGSMLHRRVVPAMHYVQLDLFEASGL